MNLYRAAEDDYIDTGYSFATAEETARLYLDNPGFGGHGVYRCSTKKQSTTNSRRSRKIDVAFPDVSGTEM